MFDKTEATEFLRGMRQARQYTTDPVSDDDLRAILAVAQWTGSAMNQQPWEFVVLQDRSRIAALGAIDRYISFCGGAPLVILPVMYGSAIAEHAFDEGRLVERIMLAAAARGLGAGVGWLHGEAVAGVGEMIAMPAGRVVRSIVAIGRPAVVEGSGSRPAQPRRPLSELVHYESFAAPSAD